MSKYSDILGKQITITVDRPLGSVHPDYPEHYYPINYGFVEGILGGDGEEQDVYLLGVDKPVASYEAVVIAVIHRTDDVEDKWVAAPLNMSFSTEDIRRLTYFQERFYHSELFVMNCISLGTLKRMHCMRFLLPGQTSVTMAVSGGSMKPERVYFEPKALDYPLGRQLREQFADVEWIPIDNHNNIEELRTNPNDAFAQMKRFLIVGVRKSLRYTPNHKVSDYLVPYTSSGCTAMCLYCYLVCHYNKCAYLRLFVNREDMLKRMIKTAASQEKEPVFEIGSNSDLVLENTITGNLVWTIEQFCASQRGKLTFPTKFDMVEPLLPLHHNGRVIFRMSVNPQEVINAVELGTSPLKARIRALNQMCEAGYEVGILIAPIVLLEGYRGKYAKLIEQLGAELTEKTKRKLVIEIIFMTYSFVHRAINNDAFPKAVELYDTSLMTVRGRGRYCYKENVRAEAEAFLRSQLAEHLAEVPILYVV